MKIKLLIAASLLAGGMSFAAPAQAQMSDNPWTFSPQNRASIAALIRSVEEDDSNNSGVVASGTGGGIVNLVCGGEADTSAKANGSCIILNNSEGAVIDILQDSEGDQTASTEDNVTVDETIVNGNGEGVDEILDTLNGDS